MDMEHEHRVSRFLIDWIHFRNSHSLGPVIIQAFMVLCAFLIVLGLTYVLLLVIAIAIHHFLFDRDPRKVPDYVKNSIQFSSESEGSDTEQERGDDDDDANSQDDNNDRASKITRNADLARKMANLDKFLSQDVKESKSKMRADRK